MSVTMYAVSGVGNDLNSGSTTSALPKVSGTGASTVAGVTVTLISDSPDLSTVVVGDTIRLNGRTDGKNPSNPSDIFEITAVDNVLKTVDVTPAPNSITSGVTWAIGGAFLTLNRLTFTASQGDLLYFNGIFNESIDMVNNVAQGALTAPIRLIGYGTTPGDGEIGTLDSNNTKSNCIIIRNGDNYWSFESLRITRFTGQGFRSAFASTPSRFIKCEVDHCGGTFGFGVPTYSTVIDCYAHDNTGHGFSSFEMCLHVGCVAVANSGDGFFGDGGNHYYNSIAVGNLTTGFRQNDDLNHKGLMMLNCLVDGSGITQTGIRIADDIAVRQGVIINTIVIDCISGVVAQTDNNIFANGLNNLVHNCVVPYFNWTDSYGSVSGEPLFVDRDKLDYRPVAGGAQVGAGNDLDISSWIPLP